MKHRRQTLADFEARSVQLLAACTLGLAGMASVPPASAARITGQTTSSPGPSSNTATADTGEVGFNAPPRLHSGKARH